MERKSPPRSTTLQTPRLLLRPSTPADAACAFEIQSDWNVTRNLRMASFPPDRAELEAWFASHEKEWQGGTAYRFAMLLNGEMIGLIDVDEIANREGDIGYWLEARHWGRGYAFEAAQALVHFAFETLGLAALNSGHAADNPASGRVLSKLGFNSVDEIELPYRSRGTNVLHKRYRLAAP